MSDTKTLPRVITAEEVKPGQHVAVYSVVDGENLFMVGEVTEIKYGCVYVNDGERSDHWEHADEDNTWFLLADAPETPRRPAAWHKLRQSMIERDDTCPHTPWRGTPITPQSIRTGDLYDIHTIHGTVIRGILAGRNGVYNAKSGDQVRLVARNKD